MACGACVQAAALTQKPDAPSMYVRNVTPLTIRMYASCVTPSGKRVQCCAPIIHRNSSYPIEKKLVGQTNRDNQTKVSIRLFEGEHLEEKKNRFLGSMVMRGLQPSPKGVERMDIVLKIDEKAMLSATAVDQRTKMHRSIQIKKPVEFSDTILLVMTLNIDQFSKVETSGDDAVVLEFQTKRLAKRPKVEKENDGNSLGKSIVCPIYGSRNVGVEPMATIEIDDSEDE